MSDQSGLSIRDLAQKLGSALNPIRSVIHEEIFEARCKVVYRGPETEPSHLEMMTSLAKNSALAFVSGRDETKIYREPDARIIELTPAGVEWINDWPDETYDSYALIPKQKGPHKQSGIPASDRTVTLNHNQPEYQDAIKSLDDAIKAFDEEHCLDNELGPEKSIIGDSLQTAKKYLQLREINFRIGMTLIVENLRNIAARFAKAVAGAAVKNFFEVAADKIYDILNSN
jgi:hypothetical protein